MTATPLRAVWSALAPRLALLETVPFSDGDWSLLERLHASFADCEAHVRLPLAIARVRADACTAILAEARRRDDVATVAVEADGGAADETMADDAMAPFARLYAQDVDALLRVLVPSARYRKGHYAWGRFTVPSPHGLHTDHSAEDPQATAEPICIARIGALGTHYVAGDVRAHDPETKRMLEALRYWTAVPEGEPEAIFETLLARGTLATIPVDHVVLMVAGNASPDAQITQHIAARPPEGGLPSAFFQRQYRLDSVDRPESSRR